MATVQPATPPLLLTDSHDFGSAESPAVTRSYSCFNTLARSVVRGIVKEFVAVNVTPQ